MLSQWFLVGPGRCGVQMARAIHAAGLSLVGVEARSARGRARVRRVLAGVALVSEDEPLPPAEAILIAVPDSAIPGCAARLAPRLHRTTTVVLHTSGLLGSDALSPIADRGVSTGSLHPLVSFSSATGPLAGLRGSVATVEGDAAAVRAARRLATALGMRPVPIAAAVKPRYHATLALAANLTHALVATAASGLATAGFARPLAVAALRPLVTGAVEAALAARGMENLTGPLARGDAEAVAAHLAALPADAADAYRAVAALAVGAIAAQHLLDEARVAELERALTGLGRYARFHPLT